MDDLSGIAVFTQVVEAESFSGAATRLGVSKSAVSKQVSKLEDRLGARLLNRTTRRISLTDVGQAYYERAVRIIAEVEEAKIAVTNLTTAPRGTLRVSAPTSFGSRWLGAIVPDFMARYPELSVDLSLNDRFVDLVEEGIDVAVRIGDLPDSSLVARKLGPVRLVVCAAPAYWKQHGKPKVPADLVNHNCLLFRHQNLRDDWPFETNGVRKSVRVKGTLQSDNGEVLASAAAAGLGVVSLPRFIVEPALTAGRLEVALEDHSEKPLNAYAVYPHSRHLSIKVRAFIDFLLEHPVEASCQ